LAPAQKTEQRDAESGRSGMARSVSVSDIIDGHRLSRFQIGIIVWCLIVALIDGFDALSIAFAAPLMARDLAIPINSFGPIFGAGTLGLTVGALTLPVLADRFGRKAMIIIACVIFGLLTLSTVLADSFTSLLLIRLATGLGVGAATPNCVALATEYAPRRMRAFLVTIVTGGFPLGAVIGGAISAQLIPVWGWHAVFYLGGISPLVLGAVLLFVLPESIRFLVDRDPTSPRIAQYLKRIAPEVAIAPGDRFVIDEPHVGGFTVKHLFTDGRGSITLLLWLAFFMNLLLLFFMFNWLPPVMQQAGAPIKIAIIATVLFNLGGVIGGLVLGWLSDRHNPYKVLWIAYAFGALCVGSIGFLGFSIPLIMAVIAVAGFCGVGGQGVANALAAISYPTSMRATGVGWALGIGRAGSIVGPVVGGIALSLGFGLREIFLTAAVPALVAALAIALLGQLLRGRAARAR
jgi:AAHS family 4-hydroxybenzoate transporter-like MFS transporter